MNVWRLVQGQRQVQWQGKIAGPRQGAEQELQPAELAGLESGLETRQESKPEAELLSVPSELALKAL